ncbi:MAG: citrate transporter [Lachnospiraceae bacterium]|nr:citrate transporter [Lachnospiraceae bacterium]
MDIFKIFKGRKLDPVLCAAWIFAAISAFFVHPGSAYLGYIDWRSLGILWALMVIIQGFRENAIFEKIAEFLLSKVKSGWQLAAVLIFMCFFGSMLITNDVALITFVPFALMILHSCKRDDMMIPVVVFQTVAANLGSMFTPVGNPQNLYLYGVTGMSITAFLSTMLPYTLAAAVLLCIALLTLPDKNAKINVSSEFMTVKSFGSIKQIVIYSCLFVLALLTVLRIIPWYILCALVLIIVAGMDYKIVLQADYILLLTFIGFFIFTGNIGNIPEIKVLLQKIVTDREFAVAIITSQFISNVPATLMLSDFTSDYKELLLGVNVGGLGTLIASMASLISYKAYTSANKDKTKKYLLTFTVVNIIFLAILVSLKMVLS